MRDFKGMKRQRGRNRNTGGKPQQHNANRAYDSNGPEGIKVRGAAQGVFEKYQQLARDATTGGDRVLAENYLQHAEHYFRLLRAIQPNRPVSDIVGRDHYSNGLDIDFEAEHEDPPEGSVQETYGQNDSENDERPRFDNNNNNNRQNQNQNRDERPRDRDRFEGNRQNFDGNRQNQNSNQGSGQNSGQNSGQGQNRDDRPRDRWRDRDDRPRDQQQGRDDRPRDDRPRDDRPRDDRPQRDDRPRQDAPQQADAPREDRPREDRPREEREGGRRSRYDRNRDRDDRGEARDPLAVIEPQAAAPLAPEAPAESSPRLRGQDGAVSELPGFLSRGAEPREEAAEAAPKPKRRRAPKSFEGGDAPKTSEDA
jgi:hypothetical protein